MAPPSFADLGKAARDIFSSGYYLNIFSVEAKTKTQKDIELKAEIVSERDNGKVTGSIESVYKWADYGLTFTERWNTDNVLSAEIAVEDQITEGLELGLEVSFAPQSGEKNASVKAGYKTDYLQLNGDVDLDLEGPTLHASAVLGLEGWLAGYEATFDTSQSKLTSSNFGFGFAAGDFSFTTIVNDGQEFSGDIYHKVHENLEVGIGLSWSADTRNTYFGIGGRYKLAEDVSFSAKVDNKSTIGLSYTQSLRPEVKLTLSSVIDAKSISHGGHKFGFGLEFEG